MKPTKITMNDIAQWIDNDEGLYNWWRSSKTSKRKFITENRAELKACIRNVLDGTKPAHYLAY
jgi:hypothetical protein